MTTQSLFSGNGTAAEIEGGEAMEDLLPGRAFGLGWLRRLHLQKRRARSSFLASAVGEEPEPTFRRYRGDQRRLAYPFDAEASN